MWHIDQVRGGLPGFGNLRDSEREGTMVILVLQKGPFGGAVTEVVNRNEMEARET